MTILYIQEEIQILLMNYNGNLDSENSYDSKGRLGSDNHGPTLGPPCIIEEYSKFPLIPLKV